MTNKRIEFINQETKEIAKRFKRLGKAIDKYKITIKEFEVAISKIREEEKHGKEIIDSK